MGAHSIASLIAGIFSISAIFICTYQIRGHLMYTSCPDLTKYIVRMLGLVPVYAIQSWLGLIFAQHVHAFDLIRGEENIISLLEKKKAATFNHIWPVNLIIQPWIIGSKFLHNTKIGTLQYVVIKPLIAILIVLLKVVTLYSKYNGHFFFSFLVSLSQTWAIYCLVLFYWAMKDELNQLHTPVFATFWQSLFIEMLVSLKVIQSVEKYEADDVAAAFQDFLICIEMLIFALLFNYAFPIDEFREENQTTARPIIRSFFTSVDYSDIVGEVQNAVRTQISSKANENEDPGETDELLNKHYTQNLYTDSDSIDPSLLKYPELIEDLK